MPDELDIKKDDGWDGVDRRKLVDQGDDIKEWHRSLETWQMSVDRKQSFTTFIVGIVSLILVIGFIATFAAGSALQSSQNDRAVELAKANALLTQQIQTERRNSLIISCNDTNGKYREAISRSRKYPDTTRAIINDLTDIFAPLREDCDAYADSRVKAR